MARKIKFSLVYRDMWQSSGKYVPTIAQLKQVAPHIIDMGCFSRVETNGGGFEQINLLFGENPNTVVREWTKPFQDAGIQTHMLERALNGIRMYPVPADVRKLMCQVKKAQGVDIARSFCGLNDPRNMLNSIKFAKEAGMTAQAAMSITYSKIHTPEYFSSLAKSFVEAGADEICLKDMAGVARPKFVGKIVANIKKNAPDIPITYHGHTTPGFAVANILQAVENGVEYVDCAMEPLSWGTVHPDILTVQAMLKDAGYDVPEINMDAYMKVRKLNQDFIDDFLGYYISEKNRFMTSLLIKPGLPGGMMGSLMDDLKDNLTSINKWKEKKKKTPLTEDELLIKLFNEVEYIWPKLGYPPLVTPFSQYVKNLAMMNVIQMEKGKKRWSMIASDIWDMISGKSGQLPGELDPKIIELAKQQGQEFYDGNPQDLVPGKLDEFRKEMDKNGWEYGQDNEELFELAMHPEQYRKYKSGEAKENFENDITTKKAEKLRTSLSSENNKPTTMQITVNGEKYQVTVSYKEDQKAEKDKKSTTSQQADVSAGDDEVYPVTAPLEGTFYFTKDSSETPVRKGDIVEEGNCIGYIESMKTYNAITADRSGKITELCVHDGATVDEDDVLVKIM